MDLANVSDHLPSLTRLKRLADACVKKRTPHVVVLYAIRDVQLSHFGILFRKKKQKNSKLIKVNISMAFYIVPTE